MTRRELTAIPGYMLKSGKCLLVIGVAIHNHLYPRIQLQQQRQTSKPMWYVDNRTRTDLYNDNGLRTGLNQVGKTKEKKKGTRKLPKPHLGGHHASSHAGTLAMKEERQNGKR